MNLWPAIAPVGEESGASNIPSLFPKTSVWDSPRKLLQSEYHHNNPWHEYADGHTRLRLPDI